MEASATKWDDSLLEGHPGDLLHWFACDCAQRALLRERSEGRVPDERSWEAVETKRMWLMGRASDQELYDAYQAAKDAASEWGGSSEPKIRGFQLAPGPEPRKLGQLASLADRHKPRLRQEPPRKKCRMVRCMGRQTHH